MPRIRRRSLRSGTSTAGRSCSTSASSTRRSTSISRRTKPRRPLSAFLFNIGQCYRNLGDYDAAVFSFKKYLKLEPDAENREQVEEYITELETEQEKGNSKKFKLDKKKEEPEATASPVYKKWWFWTGLAVVGVAGGVGIYAATRSDSTAPPMTTLGLPPIVFNP